VVQWFFPHFEIVCGEVDSGSAREAHFWNVDPSRNPAKQVDLTWQQFAEGSKVTSCKILDRHALNDSPPTIARCELLLKRVLNRLEEAPLTSEGAAPNIQGFGLVVGGTIGKQTTARDSQHENVFTGLGG
jgi:hypothetical protein